jgi:type IV secretory pathway TraG/TraD family ATPase VirD4
LVLVAAPWLAGMLFAAFVGARNYVLGYLEYLGMWRAYAVAPHYKLLLELAACIALAPAIILALLPVLASRPVLFGDAHFADEAEIRAAGLRAPTGVILGRLRGRLLRAQGQLGVLLFAPPRSGKGVGFVIPNLLTWQGSAIVNDLKLENFEKTSGTRHEMGQSVVLFAPLDPNGRTHGYNPLNFVSRDPALRVNDVQAITAKLVQTPPRADPMWSNEARVLLDGLILFLLDVNPRASLGAIYRMVLSVPNFADYIQYGLLGQLPGGDEPHQVLALLDEFTALGRLENVEKGIAYFAGYNIVLAPVRGLTATLGVGGQRPLSMLMPIKSRIFH